MDLHVYISIFKDISSIMIGLEGPSKFPHPIFVHVVKIHSFKSNSTFPHFFLWIVKTYCVHIQFFVHVVKIHGFKWNSTFPHLFFVMDCQNFMVSGPFPRFHIHFFIWIDKFTSNKVSP